MLSCRPLHFYIKTDAGTFLVNKNFKMTTFTLTGITKRVNFIYYHVAYTFSDGRIRYTEMRRENICKDKIYLKCVNKKNCKVFLSIFVKNPIRIEKTGQRTFDFMPDVTVDMLMNVENYGDSYYYPALTLCEHLPLSLALSEKSCIGKSKLVLA